MKIRIVLNVTSPEDSLARDFVTKMKRLRTALRWIGWSEHTLKVTIAP
jgi:hypothetical protein